MATFVMHAVLLFCLSAGAADWRATARRLTGLSESVRQRAITELRGVPHLASTLRASLQGPDKALALDVIAALNLEDLLPDLLLASQTDTDGTTYLAIGALLDDHNARSIADAYVHRLRETTTRPVSMTAQVIMLDTLARLGARMSEPEVLRLLDSPIFEVRSAALYYARVWMRKARRNDFEGVIRAALHCEPYQLRVQALYTVWDLRDVLGDKTRDLLGQCTGDDSEEVRELCKSIQHGAL